VIVYNIAMLFVFHTLWFSTTLFLFASRRSLALYVILLYLFCNIIVLTYCYWDLSFYCRCKDYCYCYCYYDVSLSPQHQQLRLHSDADVASEQQQRMMIQLIAVHWRSPRRRIAMRLQKQGL
jgi:hypothetical protein